MIGRMVYWFTLVRVQAVCIIDGVARTQFFMSRTDLSIARGRYIDAD